LIRNPRAGVLCGGEQFQQGKKRETALNKPGMGYFQFRQGDDLIPKEEYVDVQGTFPPAPLPLPVPAEGFFDPVDVFQQFQGAGAVQARYGGVIEPGLIDHVEGVRLQYPRNLEAFQEGLKGFYGVLEDTP
jgi:hypothetical protein